MKNSIYKQFISIISLCLLFGLVATKTVNAAEDKYQITASPTGDCLTDGTITLDGTTYTYIQSNDVANVPFRIAIAENSSNQLIWILMKERNEIPDEFLYDAEIQVYVNGTKITTESINPDCSKTMYAFALNTIISPQQTVSVKFQYHTKTGYPCDYPTHPYNSTDDWAWVSEFLVKNLETLQPEIRVSPTSLTCDDTQVGNTSGYKSFTIYNDGNANLTVSLASSNSQFQISKYSSSSYSSSISQYSISAGSSSTIYVKFTPSSSGNKSTTITITNNDANENPTTVNVSGNGVAPPAPSNLRLAYTSNIPSTIPASGGTYTIRVYNDGDQTLYWNVSNMPSWISLSTTSSVSGNNYRSVDVIVQSNPNLAARSASEVKLYNTDNSSDYEYLNFSQIYTPNQLPSISITSPANYSSTQNASITVSGTASDSDGSISYVQLKVGTGNWQTISGTTNWSGTANLAYGINMIYARAYDDDGSYKEASISVTREEPMQVSTPTFTSPEGTYTSAQSVQINCTTPSVSIYYTTDGTTPSQTNGILYNGSAIMISSTTTIKAKAYSSGYTESSLASATYTINTPSFTITLPNATNTYNVGDVLTYSWTISNFTGQLRVQLVDENNAVIVSDLALVSYNASPKSWTIPTNNAAIKTGKYKIKMYESGATSNPLIAYSQLFTINNAATEPLVNIYRQNADLEDLKKIKNTNSFILNEVVISQPIADFNGTVIKVLVVYPEDIGETDEDVIEAIDNSFVTQINQSFINSNIDLRMQFVHIERLTDFIESEQQDLIQNVKIMINGEEKEISVYNGGKLLEQIKQIDHKVDDIHLIRERYGADLVLYLSGRKDLYSLSNKFFIAGIAKQPAKSTYNNLSRLSELGFSIVKYKSLNNLSYTTIHEIGHNLGAGHNQEDGKGSFNYSYGYRCLISNYQRLFETINFNNEIWYISPYRTIMSYSGKDINRRIDYGENPRQLYWSAPEDHPDYEDAAYVLGDAGHNNKRTITETKDKIANNRNETLLIKNTGQGALRIVNVASNKMWLTITSTQTLHNKVLNNGEEVDFTMNVNWNNVSSVQNAVITITTDDPNNSTIEIAVTAQPYIAPQAANVPVMALAHDNIQFEAGLNNIPLFVDNAGVGDLDYKAEIWSGNDWLSLSSKKSTNTNYNLICESNNDCPRYGEILFTSTNSLVDSIILNVYQSSISIKADPKDTVIIAETPVTLRANANSANVISYQWFKNDSILLVGETRNTLVVNDLADTTFYSVRIASACDTVFTYSGMVTIGETETFIIPIKGGQINMISLPVKPVTFANPDLFGGTELYYLQSDDGLCVPSWNVNNINLNIQHGVKVFNNEDVTLSLIGLPQNGGYTISLPANSIRLIGFPYTQPHTAQELFGNYPEIIYAADDEGNLYIPSWGLTDATFYPGKALKIYTTANLNYYFPEFSNAPNKKGGTKSYDYKSGLLYRVNKSGDVYPLIIDSIIGKQNELPYGTELYAFDGDTCVGSVIHEGQETLFINTWLGNKMLNLKGANEGNPIVVKVRFPNSDDIFTTTADYKTGGTFGEGAYSVANLKIETTTNVNNLIVDNAQLSVFPNPTSGAVTFSYILPDNANTARIEVVDLSGRKIKSFLLESKVKENQLQWTSNNISGTYFCRLIVDEHIIATQNLVFTK